jgi:hypothetical protein
MSAERNSNATNHSARKLRAPIFSRNDFLREREKKSGKFFRRDQTLW